MRKNKVDPNIKAQAVWAKAVDGAGFAKPGDLVMSLRINHNGKEVDAELAFIEAFGLLGKAYNRVRRLHQRSASA